MDIETSILDQVIKLLPCTAILALILMFGKLVWPFRNYPQACSIVSIYAALLVAFSNAIVAAHDFESFKILLVVVWLFLALLECSTLFSLLKIEKNVARAVEIRQRRQAMGLDFRQ